MTMLGSTHNKHKVKLIFFVKAVTFIILCWLYKHNNDENAITMPLVNGSKGNTSLGKITHRLLAKYDKQNELGNIRFQNKKHDNRENYKLMYGRESNNTYEQLRRGKSNHMEAYLKGYSQRYAKKSGLKKWDCYCEKKVFDKIDKVMKYIEQKNISEKHVKKFLFKKYGLPLILLSLIPLFGIIIPILTINNDHIVKKCGVQIISKENKKYYRHIHDNCTLFPIGCVFLNNIIFSLSVFTIIFLIIYTIIKVAKYERIKAGY